MELVWYRSKRREEKRWNEGFSSMQSGTFKWRDEERKVREITEGMRKGPRKRVRGVGGGMGVWGGGRFKALENNCTNRLCY